MDDNEPKGLTVGTVIIVVAMIVNLAVNAWTGSVGWGWAAFFATGGALTALVTYGFTIDD